ncbi:ABC transporter permease [Cellulomonas bogoriensis]|uniref:ABC transporter permease n=1 Tax=Cellulomonas bogoriensis 69B4 = DSM 16987 TaxID=1386082 RepID=A0A0A0BWR5_9CELL|nr:ABC transporter permease [Cellulomonas bogoriensis]KGM12415.1 ABC transporter permease [Cellulomonas bogoriensis 69B4 = DSM 16987]
MTRPAPEPAAVALPQVASVLVPPTRRTADRPALWWAGAVTLALLVLFALLGPLIWREPIAQDLSRFLQAPTPAEPLGHDHLGRSVIARLAHATRLSLVLAILCVTVAMIAGTLTGILAAWRGRWVDTLLHGLSETLVAIPALLIVLIASAAGGGGLTMLFVGIALVQWIEYFRVVRARSGVLLAGPGVEAARLLGLGPVHVLRRHLWPELRPVLLTMASFGIGTAVLTLSTLGFVGVGVSPPTPELGLMITEAFPFYSEAPWMSLAPVLVLAATLLGLLGIRGTEARS